MQRSLRYIVPMGALCAGFIFNSGYPAFAAGTDCRAQIADLRAELQNGKVSVSNREAAEVHLSEAENALGTTDSTGASGSTGTTGTSGTTDGSGTSSSSGSGTSGTTGNTTAPDTTTSPTTAAGESECMEHLKEARSAAGLK